VSDGSIFEQDPNFGCVTNGLVSIIDSEFNAHDYQFDISNCTEQLANLNGASFSEWPAWATLLARTPVKSPQPEWLTVFRYR
jgi:hypothetical protein